MLLLRSHGAYVQNTSANKIHQLHQTASPARVQQRKGRQLRIHPISAAASTLQTTITAALPRQLLPPPHAPVTSLPLHGEISKLQTAYRCMCCCRS
jgi:hypothetical protein